MKCKCGKEAKIRGVYCPECYTAMKDFQRGKVKDEHKREIEKAMNDAQKTGFGIFDQETRKRINPKTLSFFWQNEKAGKPKANVVLNRDLMTIEHIYKEKFGKQSPYEIQLFNIDEGHFIERLIRATEICTLKYVLNKGGSLNKCTATITRGRRKFLWEE